MTPAPHRAEHGPARNRQAVGRGAGRASAAAPARSRARRVPRGGTIALWLALLLCGSALAEPPISVRAMLVRWSGAVPLLSFGAQDFVTPSVARKLDSGLPQRIVTRVYAYAENGKQPISLTAMSCRVAYDLWEGVYRVEEQTDATDRSRTLPDQAAVVRACLDVRALALGDGEAYQRFAGKSVYFAAIIELNPMSADTVQRIRRWLSKSGGGQLRADAFFGSFVSIFVSRRMGSAEATLAFRSQTFVVPP